MATPAWLDALMQGPPGPPGPSGGGFAGAGDLSGTSTQTVIGLQGRPLASTAPTNGQLVTWSSGASSWVPASPAALTTNTTTRGLSTAKPGSPLTGDVHYCTNIPMGFRWNGSTWDGFFCPTNQVGQVPALSGFTAFLAGGRAITETDYDGCIGRVITNAQSAEDYRLRVIAYPGGTARLYLDQVFMAVQSYGMAGIALRQSSNGKICLFHHYANGATQQAQVRICTASVTTGSPTYTATATPLDTAFAYMAMGGQSRLQVYDDGTTINFMMSTDGVTYTTLLAQTRAALAITPDQIGFHAGNGPIGNTSTISQLITGYKLTT